MDALALLCNLHADGPATLHRLRRAGCESIPALEDLSLGELAEQLRTDEEGARRFQREAALLAARMRGEGGESGVELDGADPSGGDLPTVATGLPDQEPEEEFRAPEVDRVLAKWRSLDRDAPPLPPGEFLVPRPPASQAGNRALEEVGIEGLDADLAERLSELGILSLRGLRDAVTVDLARDLALPFTRVRRLQFLAKRAMEELEEELPVESEASTRLDTAGPFA